MKLQSIEKIWMLANNKIKHYPNFNILNKNDVKRD